MTPPDAEKMTERNRNTVLVGDDDFRDMQAKIALLAEAGEVLRRATNVIGQSTDYKIGHTGAGQIVKDARAILDRIDSSGGAGS